MFGGAITGKIIFRLGQQNMPLGSGVQKREELGVLGSVRSGLC